MLPYTSVQGHLGDLNQTLITGASGFFHMGHHIVYLWSMLAKNIPRRSNT